MAQTKMRLAQIETITHAMELISTIALVSNGQVTFSNIPQTYQHLRILGHAKSTRTDGSDNVGLRFNSDTGQNYMDVFVAGYDNATYNADGTLAGDHVRTCHVPGWETGYTSQFSTVDIIVSHYHDASVWKSITASPGGAYNVAAALMLAVAGVGWWKSTSPITSIRLFARNAASQNLAAGTTFSLYGIRG
jgi:hypothetical protein